MSYSNMQEMKRKAKKRQKKDVDISLEFDVANAKEKDFELSMDHSNYKAMKGQAGSRSKNT